MLATSLKQITDEMNDTTNLQAAMNVVVDSVCKSLAADVCAVFINDEKLKAYVLTASTCKNQLLVKGRWHLKHGRGILGILAKELEPIKIKNITKHPKNININWDGKRTKYKAFLGVPIAFQGRLLGILTVQQKEEREFSEGEEAFLLTLSTQLAATVGNAIETGKVSDSIASFSGDKSPPTLQGSSGSTGVAIGQAHVIYPLADFSSIVDRPANDIAEDIETFKVATKKVSVELEILNEQLVELSADERSLFESYSKILASNSFSGAVINTIKAGHWVQSALRIVIRQHIKKFEAMDDVYLRERVDDIKDIGRRLLAKLQAKGKVVQVYPTNTVLIGADITASVLAEVPKGRLQAIISGSGSENSHAAILARGLGIPAVMGVDHLPLNSIANKKLIVDGYAGRIYIEPTYVLEKAYKRLADEEQELQKHLLELVDLPTKTLDQHKVALRANIGLVAELSQAVTYKACGVGLYRTEVPFMILERFPSEEEQRIIYRQILKSFKNDPVTMRTLDVGGDKALPYFTLDEVNPYLGWRGIRVLLDHPEIFSMQIKSMLKANIGLNNLKIMLPMITTLKEIITAKKLIIAEYEELNLSGLSVSLPQIGVMLEVPALLYQLDELFSLVDFVSVGSNDLTQYLLAVDRNNSHVRNMYDSYNPALLSALNLTCRAAEKAGKPVSICGELAGDPLATVLLIGMGFTSLSMNSSSLLKVKWVLRGFSKQHAKALLKLVLALNNSTDIKEVLRQNLTDAGFGGLIRAGKY